MWVGLTGVIWCLVGIIYSKATASGEGFFPFLVLSTLVFASTIWIATPPTAWDATEVLKVVGVMLSSTVFSQCGFLCLREAMRRGSLAVSWSVSQAAMVWPFIAGLMFFGDSLNGLRIAGMATLLVSLVVLSVTKPKTNNGSREYLFFAFGAFFLIGVAQILTQVPNHLGVSEQALTWRVPAFSFSGLIWLTKCRHTKAETWKSVWKLAVTYGLVVASGQWVFYKAMDLLSKHNSIGLAYPLALGSCIALFTLYTTLVKREKLGVWGIIGICLTILGILFMAK